MRAITLLVATLLVLPTAAVGDPLADARDETPVGVSARYLLIDGNGRAVTHEDFPGRFQLLTFGYTYCPDVCPTTLAEMAAVMNALGDDAARLQPIFISVDPERDTASQLRSYVAFFHPALLALTGSPQLLRRAADSFKVRYEKVLEPGAATGEYTLDHTAGMFLLGPDGGYLRKFGYGLPVAQIAASIRETMAASPRRTGRSP